MAENKDEEKVLVVKTSELFSKGIPNGFSEVDYQKTVGLVREKGKFLERKFAEIDPEWQQIIPQVTFVVGKKLLIHRIPSTTNESRLADMWPIFFGGHVDDFDVDVEVAVERELSEEIVYKGNILKRNFLGLVHLKEPLVNSVHTGLIWVFEGDSEEFEMTADTGVSDCKFIKFSEIDKYIEKMSYWSKIVAPIIVEKYSS